MLIFFVLPQRVKYSDLFDSGSVFKVAVSPDSSAFEDWVEASGASATFVLARMPGGEHGAALQTGVVDLVATTSRESALMTSRWFEGFMLLDQEGNVLSKEPEYEWLSRPDIVGAIAAAYDTLLKGIPHKAGFDALTDTAVSTNFGAGPGPVFNAENIFINLTNNLVQGNSIAMEAFNAIATGTTLAEKITSIYQAIIPSSKQTTEGLAFITRPEGVAFYQQVASERGVEGDDGAAIIALASLLKIVVDQDIGVGNSVNDLLKAVAAGSDMLPESGSVFTDIEVADGTQFDGDDAASSAPPEPNEAESLVLIGFKMGDDHSLAL